MRVVARVKHNADYYPHFRFRGLGYHCSTGAGWAMIRFSKAHSNLLAGLFIVASITGVLIYAGWPGRAPPEPSSEPASEPVRSEPACDMAWSKNAVLAAEATSLIRDMAVRRDGLHVVVSAGRWSSLSLDQKDQLISAADCAIAGPDYLRRVQVETATGEPLKAYKALDLRDARRLQPIAP